ncbi:outer membrane porin, OprD family [Acinetobacter marinus]|uniref:Outer membrane porin, OprD family n=2 Tax=Acinetobacter marinus TaxID=281375 RepID=A0A1G6GLJ7_9GAMM|nr:outer membrane porin, OprD family [Acinetobacter marinus]
MMKKALILPTLMAVSVSTQLYAEGFIDDSSVSLTARNFYMNKNFYNNTVNQPSAVSWAQGFIFDAKSGYTPGKVQFGVDLLATLGLNINSDNTSRGVYMVPNDDTTSWGDIAVTGKAKVSQTELKVGAISIMNPVFITSPARLLPQIFRGGSINSKEFDNLELTAAYVNQVNHRDSTDWEKITLANTNWRFKQQAETDAVYFGGGYYKFSPKTKAHLFYLNVDDIYDQIEGGVENTTALTDEVNLLTDVKYYRSRDIGDANGGNVDNDMYMANFGFQRGAHKLSLGTIINSGETAFPYLYNSEVGVFLDTWPNEFWNAKEHTYSIRYDYDAKEVLPGLKFMTRYTYGNNIHTTGNQSLPGGNQDLLGGDNLHESELDFDVQYRVPEGTFKNLGLRARYAISDNNMTSSAQIKPTKETRINIDYTWKFK